MILLGVIATLAFSQLYPFALSPVPPGSDETAAKAAYSSSGGYAIRFAVYAAVWAWLAWYFRSRSLRQDRDGDVRWSLRMERMSAPGMIAFAITITLAAVDLLMSLNPNWSSTMIGVYFFSGSVVAGLVVATLLAIWLQAAGKLQGAISVEHYHDLGKLTFAFTVFWGYIAFSQYMLIWYANMPEETHFSAAAARTVGRRVAGAVVLPPADSAVRADVAARQAASGGVYLLGRVALGGPSAGPLLAGDAQRVHPADSRGRRSVAERALAGSAGKTVEHEPVGLSIIAGVQ